MQRPYGFITQIINDNSVYNVSDHISGYYNSHSIAYFNLKITNSPAAIYNCE